jgi:hypothetical protein
MAVAYYNCHKFVTVLRNGCFTSEKRRPAVSEAKPPPPPASRSGFKYPLKLLENSSYNSFSRRGLGVLIICQWKNFKSTWGVETET